MILHLYNIQHFCITAHLSAQQEMCATDKIYIITRQERAKFCES